MSLHIIANVRTYSIRLGANQSYLVLFSENYFFF